MIICRMCGNHNDESSAFCGDCGKFLEWSGEKVAPPPEVMIVVEEPPPVAPEQLSWWGRVKRWAGEKLPRSSTVEPRQPVAAAVAATWTSTVDTPPPAPA